MAVYETDTISGTQNYRDLLDRLRDFASADHVDTVAVNAAGTGYVAGEILTISGGTVTTLAATVEVTSVGGSGEVTGVKIRQSGGYSSNPSTPNSPTGGSGSGCTLDLTFTGILWTVNRDEVGNHQASELEVQLQGVGDGSDEIYVGIRTFTSSSATNWELAGFTGYADALTWENQPGKSPGSYTSSGAIVPLSDNLDITYWFNITGRRIICGFSVSGGYPSLYLGWMNPFATGVEYPYPMLVMGCTSEVDQQPDTTEISYSGISDPVADLGTDDGPGLVRSPDGQWYSVRNSAGVGGGRAREEDRVVLPAGWPGLPSGADLWFFSGDDRIARGVVPLNGDPGSPTDAWVPTTDSGGDIYTPLPCTVLMTTPSIILMGQMDDVYWLSAEGAQAEDTLDSTNFTVFQCGNRSEPWAHFCIRTSE